MSFDLRSWRERLGIRASTLSELTGVSRSRISDFEHGRRQSPVAISTLRAMLGRLERVRRVYGALVDLNDVSVARLLLAQSESPIDSESHDTVAGESAETGRDTN